MGRNIGPQQVIFSGMVQGKSVSGREGMMDGIERPKGGLIPGILCALLYSRRLLRRLELRIMHIMRRFR
jgi:hypothetical protein